MRNPGYIILAMLAFAVVALTTMKLLQQSNIQADIEVGNSGPQKPQLHANLDWKGIAEVVDGDTIRLDNKLVRLFGIDAPEKSQKCGVGDDITMCGHRSTAVLQKMAGGQIVECVKQSNDQYGRDVAICYSSGVDIGRQMVRTGWALAYRKYSYKYVEDEELAKRALLGVWKGEFKRPAEWRSDRRQ
ncbi:thermonuclease family protein [Parasphingorhabdus sp.]|uniref:thermonuclease family protein n=1 Tax=Parasphingorhabdus sp. TaxID=2709688 RepID=UPI003D27521C